MAICKAVQTRVAGSSGAIAQPTILRECRFSTAARYSQLLPTYQSFGITWASLNMKSDNSSRSPMDQGHHGCASLICIHPRKRRMASVRG